MQVVLRSVPGDNQKITPEQLQEIRGLDDFDLKMLISEVHDHGWPRAAKLLPMILDAALRQCWPSC
jgi:hypothetical protein